MTASYPATEKGEEEKELGLRPLRERKEKKKQATKPTQEKRGNSLCPDLITRGREKKVSVQGSSTW